MKNIRIHQGFTLIELLVVISIIALLVSILLPALNSARQTAYRVVCASGLRSNGQAMVLYCQDQKGSLPPTRVDITASSETWGWRSLVVQDANPPVFKPNSTTELEWFSLGTLKETGVLDDFKTFYCPGVANAAAKSSAPWLSCDYYTNPQTGEWYMPPNDVRIRVSYNYWSHGQKKLDKISQRPYYYDTIQDWDSIPHRSSNGQPKGMNVLYGDGHVVFVSPAELFDWDLWHPYGPGATGTDQGPGNHGLSFLKILAMAEGKDPERVKEEEPFSW